MTTPTTVGSVPRPKVLTVVGGLVGAAAVAILLNAVVAAIAHGAGASDDFRPLQLPTYGFLTAVGVLVSAAGWAIVRARAARPRALLRTLVSVVLVLSFVPDVLVGIDGTMAGTSWGSVVALMVMHLVVAAVAVGAYMRLFPLPVDRTPRDIT